MTNIYDCLVRAREVVRYTESYKKNIKYNGCERLMEYLGDTISKDMTIPVETGKKYLVVFRQSIKPIDSKTSKMIMLSVIKDVSTKQALACIEFKESDWKM